MQRIHNLLSLPLAREKRVLWANDFTLEERLKGNW